LAGVRRAGGVDPGLVGKRRFGGGFEVRGADAEGDVGDLAFVGLGGGGLDFIAGETLGGVEAVEGRGVDVAEEAAGWEVVDDLRGVVFGVFG